MEGFTYNDTGGTMLLMLSVSEMLREAKGVQLGSCALNFSIQVYLFYRFVFRKKFGTSILSTFLKAVSVNI